MFSKGFFFGTMALASLSTSLAVLSDGPNPLKGQVLYVNPFFQSELDTSIATSEGKVKKNLQEMRDVSSAYWLDVRAKVKFNGTPGETWSMEGILKDAAAMNPVPLVTFIVYDLPNRDCHARASNGEICCTAKADGTCDYEAPGDCADGIAVYKQEYIDPLTEVLSKYDSKVPIVLIIEPDSLPNLATNIGNPRCGSAATMNAYRTGIKYAVEQIAKHAPKTTMYLDAAHGGWLGWTNSLTKFLGTLVDMELLPKVRGFALNTANYQPIGVQCPFYDWCLGGKNLKDPCCNDPCKLATQYNAGNNELNYALTLYNFTTTLIPGYQPKFVIDTGRNGVTDMRKTCSNWCNIRNAGVGLKPTVETASPIVDAYLWLKTPGESDGCTQVLPGGGEKQCARYDSMCGSEDSIGSQPDEPRAPEAGRWFDYQVKQLAGNANFNAHGQQGQANQQGNL